VNTVFVAVKVAAPPAAPRRATEPPEEEQAWPYVPFRDHPVSAQEMQQMAAYLRTLNVQFPAGLEGRLTQFSPLQSAPRDGQVLTDNYAPVDISAGTR
jgi:hypothetical protein